MCSIRNLVEHIHIAANVYEYEYNFASTVTAIDSKKYDVMYMLRYIIAIFIITYSLIDLLGTYYFRY